MAEPKEDVQENPQGSSDSTDSGISRRSFLKGMGAGLAATGLLPAAGVRPADAAPTQAKVLGPGKTPITLKVNGKTHKVEVEPRVTLANVLRNELNLTGTKVVCNRGSCGACTVLLDGEPAYSCIMLAIEAQGKEIATIESLSNGDKLHPIQEAFIEHDGYQCGFCTPGMVMSTKALLDRNPNPTLDDVKDGLSGNICRCGAYSKIFESVLAAAKNMGKGG